MDLLSIAPNLAQDGAKARFFRFEPWNFKAQLIEVFTKEAISVQSLLVRSAVEDNAAQISKVLLWPMLRTLTALRIQTANFSSFGGFSTFHRNDPRWKPDEHRILAKLFRTASWTRNLTSL